MHDINVTKLIPITMNLLKHSSIRILLLLASYILLAPYMNMWLQALLYTISLFIKDMLVIIMPITVAVFIASTIQTFKNRAVFFIVAITIFEGFSNMSSVWYAIGSAHLVSGIFPSLEIAADAEPLEALWRLPISKPTWWAADKGAIVGLILGVLLSFSSFSFAHNSLQQTKQLVEYVLTKIFARLIPMFVLGFVAQMYVSKVLDNAISHYAAMIAILIVVITLYLAVLFLLSAGASYARFMRHIRNLLPAGGIALTSGCSLSTMPWTISGAARNLNYPSFASAIIPTTTNIQQIGDCIAQTLICSMIYVQFYGNMPDIGQLAEFSTAFVIARFATAAMLGGAIFIMLPIYETYLNFNGEMIALVLAFNVLLDPIITSSNVMANGALCRVFERVWLWFNRVFKKANSALEASFIND